MPGDVMIRCAECGTSFAWIGREQAMETRPALCPACQRLAPAPGRSRGLVKWYSRARGYGFITPAEGQDLFVHKSGLAAGQEALRAGQLVEFSRAATDRGVQAEDVVVLEVP